MKIDAAYTRPFKGPHVISASQPLELPAVHFDLGGERYAFHDFDTANRTNNNYRSRNGDPQGDAADIEGDGVNIGYTNAGEWLLYTVEVLDEGEYLFDISESAGADGGKFHLEINDVKATETIHVPNNHSWGAWRWHPETPATINLTKGIHKIKFRFENGGFNLRALRFIKNNN
ncbi:carbohydrate-binding protein [Bacteroides heparinolyticus]|uniref:carbohydrate-binding protein n=1 Tax=Prevotella heparinolytica TaxID=28113 RepID=UPI0035A01B6F